MPYQSQNTTDRPLRVFLCHSSNDKPAVRELYQKLRAEPWIQPWLDEEYIFPGDDWNLEIQKAIRETDAIIVCLSKNSITKEGYVQKEIKTALDYSDEKPERTIYIIPVRLEECKPPERLSKWQYADYFTGQRERGFKRLLFSLRRRTDSLDLKIDKFVNNAKKSVAPIDTLMNVSNIAPWLNDIDQATDYLKHITLESSAQTAVITHENFLWAYAGRLPRNAVIEVVKSVTRNWDGKKGSDLLRFIRIESTKTENMLYATRLAADIVLAIVFDAETPFSTIRHNAKQILQDIQDKRGINE